MKKTMKKILCTVLVAVMMVTGMPTSYINARETVKYYTVNWLYNRNEIICTSAYQYNEKFYPPVVSAPIDYEPSSSGKTWVLKHWVQCDGKNDVLVDGKQIIYTKGQKMPAENIYFYPVFEEVDNAFSVKFYKEDGVTFLGETKIPYGKNITDYDAPFISYFSETEDKVFNNWVNITNGKVVNTITSDISVMGTFVTEEEHFPEEYELQVIIDISSHKKNWTGITSDDKLGGGITYENAKYEDIAVQCVDRNGKISEKNLDVFSVNADTYIINFNNISYPEMLVFDFNQLDSNTCQTIGLGLGGTSVMPITINIKRSNEENYRNTYNYTFDSIDLKNVAFEKNISYSCILADGHTIDMYSAEYIYELPQFPSDYNFEEDSYSFRNYGEKISKKYFTTMYEEGPGEQLYKKKKNNSTNGLCFGFAYTTAAIYNGLPSITSIYEKNILSDNKYRNQICEIKKNDKFNIGNLEISIEDYIKYAFIYQWSQESLYDNIDMGAYITKMIQNNFLSVVIGIEDKITGEGHAFLVVGCKVIGGGDTIYYIDDSNDKDNELETLTITQNGDWYYSRPWNSTPRNNNTSRIQIFYDTHQPYNFLQTGKKATVKDCINLNGLSTTETYIENMDRVNADKVLLYVDSDSNEINCDDMVEVADYTSSGTDSNTEDVGKFYWINNDKTVTITDLAKDSNEISLAGDNTILTANVTKDSTVTMTIDESDINTQIETQKGDEYTVSVETITTDEEYNDIEILSRVTGTASGSEITATQTETGLLVTGISDGTVTLTKDDEVIETQEIKDAVGEIEITYDKTGEDEDVELDYHSHSYTSSITTPATHTSEGVETFTCDCGDSYTKPVAKLEGHTHTVTNTVAPTCTKNGLTVYTCACGDSYSETVKAKGHSYGDDGICVNCDDYNKAYDKTANDSENCSHLCHKGGFMGFIWKIVQIFIRLFKTNPVCECGAAHY